MCNGTVEGLGGRTLPVASGTSSTDELHSSDNRSLVSGTSCEPQEIYVGCPCASTRICVSDVVVLQFLTKADKRSKVVRFAHWL